MCSVTDILKTVNSNIDFDKQMEVYAYMLFSSVTRRIYLVVIIEIITILLYFDGPIQTESCGDDI